VREPEQRDAIVRVPVADGPRALVEVMRALDAEHLDPVTLVVREPSLDDVFLTLIGRPAEPVEGDGADVADDARVRGAA